MDAISADDEISIAAARKLADRLDKPDNMHGALHKLGSVIPGRHR